MFFSGLFQRKSDAPVTTPAELADAIGLSYDTYTGNPEACGNPITYDGGTLLDLNRHELIYQFDFSVISELTEDDTRQQDDLNSLDELQTLAIDVDYLEPGTRYNG